MGDGRQVYQRLVKPRCVALDKVVNHYAISSLFSQWENETKVFSYRIEKVNEERMEKGNSWLILGQVRVTSDTIPEPKDFFFGLIPSDEGYLSDLDFGR